MKKRYYVWFGAAISLFLFLRLYNIQNTFVLFGDSARDLLELNEWQKSLLPPLLGPHTSAISFNQSAWYFYWLMPFYILSNHSIYTASVAVLAFYFSWFIFGCYAVKKGWISTFELVVLFILTTLHPELIKQMRAVWNPSFVFPLVMATAITLVRVDWCRISLKALAFIAFTLLFAIGFSYSVIPFAGVAILFSSYQIWKHHPKKLTQLTKYLFLLGGAFIVVNFGTILFELKYNFLLTRNLSNQQVLQISTDIASKWQQLSIFTFYNQWLWLLLFIGTLLSFIWWRNEADKSKKLSDAVSLLLITVGVTLYFPFAIYEHYIFAILALIIGVLLNMPRIIQKILVFIFGIVWVSWFLNSNLFIAVEPSTVDKRECLVRVCSQYSSPIYVVGNSASHDHQALEYSYLAKEIGCNAFAVTEISSREPKTLAVFNQKTNFKLGKTDFYELNRFPNKQYLETFSCTPELSVSIFSFNQ